MTQAMYYPTKTALVGAFFHRLTVPFYMAIFLASLFLFSEYTHFAFLLPFLFGILYASLYVFVSTFYSYSLSDTSFVRATPFFEKKYSLSSLRFLRVDEPFPLSLLGVKKYTVAFESGMEAIYVPSSLRLEKWFDVDISQEDTVVSVDESLDPVFTYFFSLLSGIALLSLTYLFIASGNVFAVLGLWVALGFLGVSWFLLTEFDREIGVSEHGVVYTSLFFPRRTILVPREAITSVGSTLSTLSFVVRRPDNLTFSVFLGHLYPSSLMEVDLIFNRKHASLVFPVVDISMKKLDDIRILLGVKE